GRGNRRRSRGRPARRALRPARGRPARRATGGPPSAAGPAGGAPAGRSRPRGGGGGVRGGARAPPRGGPALASRRGGGAGGGGGGGLQLGEEGGGELPGAAEVPRQGGERGGLGHRDDQVVEPLGQVAERRRVVHDRRGDLVDRLLAGGVGLLLVEPLERGDVNP